MDSRAASARTSRALGCSCFVLSCLLAITLQAFVFSPISPDILEFPPTSSASLVPTNSQLQRVIKLGEGFLENPEDVCVDKSGILFTASRDGWVKRLHRNGSWENWRKIDSNALLGITTTKAGSLIVCDGEKGLLKVDEDGVTVLTTHVKGTEIRLADDVIEASDGSLYFSVASAKFGFLHWHLDLLEAKPNGQLLKYDPSSNDTSVVIDGLYFPNGVALSADQDYLVVCETWKYRCLKYWLSGEDKGKTQIFVDNLPGAPDNINLAPDGSYWIALLQLFSSKFEFVHTSKAFRHLAATYPGLYELAKSTDKKALVVNVAADGKIIRSFDDPTGEVMSFVTRGGFRKCVGAAAPTGPFLGPPVGVAMLRFCCVGDSVKLLAMGVPCTCSAARVLKKRFLDMLKREQSPLGAVLLHNQCRSSLSVLSNEVVVQFNADVVPWKFLPTQREDVWKL